MWRGPWESGLRLEALRLLGLYGPGCTSRPNTNISALEWQIMNTMRRRRKTLWICRQLSRQKYRLLKKKTTRSSQNEEEEDESGQLPVAGSQLANGDASRLSDGRAQLAYGEEALPVLDPVTGGNGTDGSAELVYDPGDGSVKEIQEPLPGMERLGVLPFIPSIENPSANVPAGE